MLCYVYVNAMKYFIFKISCGESHTLALVPSRGRVYAWGLGRSGQLGNGTILSAMIPKVVHGPWVSPNGVSTMDLDEESSLSETDYIVRHIFTGGNHCFATVVPRKVGIFGLYNAQLYICKQSFITHIILVMM